jgi:hypothetical protein
MLAGMDDGYYDAEHLRLLSIFHYIVAGFAALLGTFPLIHLTVGILMLRGDLDQPGKPGPPAAIGWVFVLIAGVMIVMGWTSAVLLALAGRMLARRRGYTFCLIAAGVACILVPFGTVLGVFTIVVLMRPSVKRLFGIVADGSAVEAASDVSG